MQTATLGVLSPQNGATVLAYAFFFGYAPGAAVASHRPPSRPGPRSRPQQGRAGQDDSAGRRATDNAAVGRAECRRSGDHAQAQIVGLLARRTPSRVDCTAGG